MSLFDIEEQEAHEAEATTAIEAAKQRVDDTLAYLTKYGAPPKRHQIVRMLEELSADLARYT